LDKSAFALKNEHIVFIGTDRQNVTPHIINSL